MRVGASQVDITPTPGVELSGYIARVQPSIGVHDRLYARALWLTTERGRLLWIHADLIGFEHAYAQDVKAALASRLGLGPHEIVLSATHTHSGPATARLINCGDADEGYLAQLHDMLVDVGVSASAQPEEAQLIVAEGLCDLGLERRGKATKHVDPRVGVLAWRRANGQYVALLANFGMHNVAMSEQNRLISADVAGRVAATLSTRLPGAPCVLLTNGAAGNVNPPAVRDDFAWVEQWGDALAESIVAALQTNAAPPPSPDVLSSARDIVQAPFAACTGADFDARLSRHVSGLEGRTGYTPERLRDGFAKWRCRMMAYEGLAAPTAPLELQVCCIGGVFWACFAAEVFSGAPDDLRRLTGRPLYVSGYTNGVVGYLAPRWAYAEGSYEVDQAFVWYGTPPIAVGAYELAEARVAELVLELAGANA